MSAPKWMASLDEVRCGLGDIEPSGLHITRHAKQRSVERHLPREVLMHATRGGKPIISGRTVVTVIPHGRAPRQLPGRMFYVPSSSSATHASNAKPCTAKKAQAVKLPPAGAPPPDDGVRVECRDFMGPVLGKGNKMLKSLQQSFDVVITIVGDSTSVVVRGASPRANVLGAVSAIEGLVKYAERQKKELDDRARKMLRQGNPLRGVATEGMATIIVAPFNHQIVGKRGSVKRALSDKFHVRVIMHEKYAHIIPLVPKPMPDGAPHRTADVIGCLDAILDIVTGLLPKGVDKDTERQLRLVLRPPLASQ